MVKLWSLGKAIAIGVLIIALWYAFWIVVLILTVKILYHLNNLSSKESNSETVNEFKDYWKKLKEVLNGYRRA